MPYLKLRWEKLENHRYYEVYLARDLFGFCLTRVWGGQGTALGYKKEELIGKNLEMILGNNHANNVLENIISMKSMSNLEIKCKAKNGDIKPVLFSGSILVDEDGDVSAIVTIAQDIIFYSFSEKYICMHQ